MVFSPSIESALNAAVSGSGGFGVGFKAVGVKPGVVQGGQELTGVNQSGAGLDQSGAGVGKREVRKLILVNRLSPGDILMLSGAILDLKKTVPGVKIDVRCPLRDQIFANNPNITPLETSDPECLIMECHYPQIHRSHEVGSHFRYAFNRYFEEIFGINIQDGPFRGDIYLSEEEKNTPSIIETKYGIKTPYFVVMSMGKNDFTNKFWSNQRYQEVIDTFALKNKITFVQVGSTNTKTTDGIVHIHKPLNNVIDLIDKTSFRELINVVYHSVGCLSGVTVLHHLCYAVPCKHPLKTRAGVCIAGSREGHVWESYGGKYLSNNGTMRCCDGGGNGACWRSRILPIDDGKDELNKSLCFFPVKLSCGQTIPKCLDLIKTEDVVKAIASYYEAGEYQGRQFSLLKYNDGTYSL